MNSSVRPFAEQGHFTAVHDAIFDEIMPVCPPNAWKVLCFVLRKTRGWRKDQDKIPYSQIRTGTGIRSDETISNALKWLVEKGLLTVDRGKDENGHQRVSQYALNLEYEVSLNSENNPTAEIEDTTKIEVEPTTEIEDGSASEIEVRPSSKIEVFNNHRVTQEPQSKNHTPVGAEISHKGSGQKEKRSQTPNRAKSPEDHIGKLIDDLEETGVHLDRDQVNKLAGNFGSLKSKGVSHSDLVRVRQRIVSEWPRIQLSPQQALSDLINRGEKRGGNYSGDDPDEKPMYWWVKTV